MTMPEDIARRIIESMPEPPTEDELDELAETGLDWITIYSSPRRFVDYPDSLTDREQLEMDDRFWRFMDHIVAVMQVVGCGPYFAALERMLPDLMTPSVQILMEMCNREDFDSHALDITRDCINASLRSEARRLGVYC